MTTLLLFNLLTQSRAARRCFPVFRRTSYGGVGSELGAVGFIFGERGKVDQAHFRQ